MRKCLKVKAVHWSDADYRNLMYDEQTEIVFKPKISEIWKYLT